MKKSMMTKLTLIILLTGVAIFGSYQANNDSKLENLLLQNIEAIAQSEAVQPNTDDCIEDKKHNCEALHPTDPDKDKTREGARWP